MKKIFSFFTIFSLCLLMSGNINAKAATAPPDVESEAAVLMDVNTGEIIYGKNENKPMAPASTTKVMTALLTLENAKLDDKVTISKVPPTAEGTSIGLKEGEIYTVNDLLHGLLLESANDCAEALAEHVGGSMDNFVKMMNERAKALGATNTNFVNPSGLYEPGHLTTAHDLSLMLKEAIKNPTFVKICRTQVYKFPPSNIDGNEKWVSTKDELIRKNSHFEYKYALAGKTGYTTLSKHTFTGAAEKDGHVLIVSMLYSQSKQNYFPDAIKLFDYGFNNYESIKLYSKGDEVANYNVTKSLNIPLVATKDVYYLINKNDYKPNVSETDIKSYLAPKIQIKDANLEKASFKQGDEILDSTITVKGKDLCGLKLASNIDREYKGLLPSSAAYKNIKPFVLALSIAVVSIFLVTLRKYINFKKKQSIIKQKYNNIVQ
ncbi:D-alanyl-D-alanine carboxypeptidase [Clostridium zeae]|uniref:serine-type D-Ala-D-Ala carboxypeptidase n=1 Tax=Clostridium zeae TaxID=2759022 RepID=A0ABQ1E8N2_9CLOT|nr:D-alanyl-D-alanine carboxypeptidase family protein [Clostridium zeae]GFZ31142.1 D-alanyl-D-alanine carboxypeptidase [Clostridium zeae]